MGIFTHKLTVSVAALCVAASAGFSASAGVTSGSSAVRDNYNAHHAALRALPAAAPSLSRKLRAARFERSAPAPSGYRSQYDARLGRATFLWAGVDNAPPALGALKPQALAIARARSFLGRQAPMLGLSREMIDEARVSNVHDSGNGPVIVRLRQSWGGIEVFDRSLNVMMSRSGRHIATSGYFAPDLKTQDAAAPLRFTLNAPQAIAAAFADMGGSFAASALSLRSRAGDYEWYARPSIGARYALIRDPRAKRVWFALPDRLVAAWYVELFANGPGNHGTDAAGYVISAEDGSLLFRNTLTASDAAAETYSYRVFADADGINQPFDSPLGNGYDPFPPARRTRRSGASAPPRIW